MTANRIVAYSAAITLATSQFVHKPISPIENQPRVSLETSRPYSAENNLQSLVDKTPHYKLSNPPFKELKRIILSRQELGNADGVYFLSSHTIGEASDALYRNTDYNIFVTAHEESHANGSHDENQTDILAAAKTGKYYFIRGLFYQPPIFF